MDLVKEQLPNLPLDNVIVEPVGKNTAPCIALSAFYINKMYEDATIAVLPSDHFIQDEDNFLEILSSANEFVNENKEAIVTIGMKPDRPETGYGQNSKYIYPIMICNNKKQTNSRDVKTLKFIILDFIRYV